MATEISPSTSNYWAIGLLAMNAKLKTSLVVAATIVVVLVMLGLWIADEQKIDSCLDRGGRWNDELRSCEGARGK